MKAIVILLLVLARMLYWWDKVSNVRGFIILRSGEGLTSFNKDNSDDFFGEKKKQTNNKAFWGDYFLRICEKTSSSNLKISNVSHKMYFCHLSIIFWIPLFSFSVPIYAPHSHSCPFHPTHRKSLEIGRMCMKLQNPPRVHSLGIYKKTTIDYAE